MSDWPKDGPLPHPCDCGRVAWDVNATLIKCKACGRLWGRVNGTWVLDPDTVPQKPEQHPLFGATIERLGAAEGNRIRIYTDPVGFCYWQDEYDRMPPDVQKAMTVSHWARVNGPDCAPGWDLKTVPWKWADGQNDAVRLSADLAESCRLGLSVLKTVLAAAGLTAGAEAATKTLAQLEGIITTTHHETPSAKDVFVAVLQALPTDEARVEVLSDVLDKCCRHCGSFSAGGGELGCNCTNDE